MTVHADRHLTSRVSTPYWFTALLEENTHRLFFMKQRQNQSNNLGEDTQSSPEEVFPYTAPGGVGGPLTVKQGNGSEKKTGKRNNERRENGGGEEKKKTHNGLLIERKNEHGRRSATALSCRLLLSVMLAQRFPNGLNDIWSTDCSRRRLTLKPLSPPSGLRKHCRMRSWRRRRQSRVWGTSPETTRDAKRSQLVQTPERRSVRDSTRFAFVLRSPFAFSPNVSHISRHFLPVGSHRTRGFLFSRPVSGRADVTRSLAVIV